MKKILLITNRLVIGGPSRHVAMLAEGLQNDYEVMVVGGNAAEGEVLALDLFDGLKNQPILIPELSRKISLSRDYKVYRKLRKIIRDFQPDIVHTHTSKVGAMGRIAAKKEGVSSIYHTYHGLIFENYFSGILNVGLLRFDRYLATFTKQIIALSPQQKEHLVNKYQICSTDKIVVIPLAIDIKMDSELRTKSRAYYGLNDSTVFIGVVGRLVKIKNLSLFLDGMDYLLKKGVYNIRVLIVGDGAEKENLMAHLRTSKRSYSYGGSEGFAKKTVIHFSSWQRELTSIYAGLDIVALTSKSEGTPMSLMEAQMAGKAIIASNVGGVQDIIPEGTGLLFDIENPNDFFKKLNILVDSDELRTQLSVQAKKHAIQQYSPHQMLSRTKGLYEND